MSHLLISAAHKSSGKTTLSIGICAELRHRGLSVQAFKKGPDYIDPLWLGSACERPCYNLDFYTQTQDEIRALFAEQARCADIGLIEGNKGLHDGLDLDGSTSNAALAALLGAPVVLVIDSQGMTRGVAPLVLGFQAFDPKVRIAGVILNKVSGPRHEGKLRQVIEHYTDVPVIGAVHRSAELEIVERHLGLIPSNEETRAAEKIEQIRRRVACEVDFDRLLWVAGTAAPVPSGLATPPKPARRVGSDVRIGIARDAAFGFYYAGDLEAFEQAGADLVPFSPVGDTRLPAVDALFLGGGFPESRMRELEANAAMRAEVRRFIDAGGAVYAECGGLMYLSRRIQWQGELRAMVGAIAADAVMHAEPQGRGYVRLRETAAFPWPNPAPPGGEVYAHEFHYSRLVGLDAGLTFGYEVLRGDGLDGRHDGLIQNNLLASYTHLRNVAANPWAGRFVGFIRGLRDQVDRDQRRATASDDRMTDLVANRKHERGVSLCLG
jgi:cobyrinic acid a,c-diamide synthase